MAIRLGVVMDPIGSIQYKKDSTFAMLLEAKRRGWDIYYFEQQDLFLRDGIAYGMAKRLQVFQDPASWFSFQGEVQIVLSELDLLLMRKDPPFNEAFIYTTHLLDHAYRAGTLIVNRPQALRDFNEKLFATWFPAYSPSSLVTSSLAQLKDFWHHHQDIVCKPLDSMGGKSIFRIKKNEVNATVIFENLTHHGTCTIMAQKFVPELKDGGDKRILMIHGKPVPHALARIPQGDDWRGNLAVGAKGVVKPLSARDHVICEAVKPVLIENGLFFVGLDIIGDYLTEINITSPTGIRELDSALNINISAMLFDAFLPFIRS